jgi:hypothetical protein
MKIKLSELRNLIRESIRDILRENDIVSWDAQTFWDEVAPTADEKNSMTNALLGGSDGERWKKIKRYYDILDDISDIENKIALKTDLEPPSSLPPRMMEKWKNFQKNEIEFLKKQKEEYLNVIKKPTEFKVFLFQLGKDAERLEAILANKKQREALSRLLMKQRENQS